MGKKVKSAKGEMVDFDHIKIKEQLAAAPSPTEVKKRQNFIENRMKRNLKKKIQVVEKAAVEVEPVLPGTEDTSIINEEKNTEVEESNTIKQKTRNKKTNEE